MLPEPLRPKQLHHTWASLGQTRVLQGSLRSKPQWTSHTQRWKENHLKPRGSVAKEEDPNPSHQPYKLQIRSM